ncbi:MAG: phosphatase PAP2 family protein [Nitriliruptorales bacterium]|nr:phosphatase PAP2 family protein [Nitriliruptorales bacterium]
MPLVLLVVGLIAAVGLIAVAASRPTRRDVRRRARRIRDAMSALLGWMHRRFGETLGTAVWLAGAYGALLTITVGVGWVVTRVGSGPGTVDRAVTQYMIAERNETMTAVMRLASDVGDTITIVVVGIVTGVIWRRQRGGWDGLAVLATSFVGAFALYTLAKRLVARARPGLDLALFEVPGLAFPSGHVTGSTAFYVAMALLLATLGIRWVVKVWLLAGSGIIVVMVALSRIYLGAHWLTDVVFAATLGAAWALISVTPAWRRAQDELPRPDRVSTQP